VALFFEVVKAAYATVNLRFFSSGVWHDMTGWLMLNVFFC